MRILILGSTGLLGSSILDILNGEIILNPSHSEINLTEIKDILNYIDNSNPTHIIYLAGITKIDDAEKNPELASILNFETPKQIAKYLSFSTTRLIYASTDAIFDGYKNMYHFTENDNPNPKSIYGKTKLKGEDAVLSASSFNTSVRLINLYGWNQKSYVYKMINLLKAGHEFEGITDQIKNPTYIDDASNCIKFIINKNLNGIYHIGSLDEITNYDFLIMVARKFKLNYSLIKKIRFENFLKNKTGHRKRNSVLITEKFNQISKNEILKTTEQSTNELHIRYLTEQ